MLPFDHRPVPPRERDAPVARGLWCWPALLPAVAIALDAAHPLAFSAALGSPAGPAGHAPGVSWLDLAAVGCLVWALVGRNRARLRDWSTPVDGRVLAGLVLAVLHAVQMRWAPEPVQWLRQIAASGLCFYALAARLRHEPRAADAIWPAFALIVLALSAFVLGQATQGFAAMERATMWVDARWASRFGLTKALLLGTILCAGRATERGARALWRATALVGAVACGLCAFAGGTGLGIASLASLDEPFYFGTSIVALLFLSALARMAWFLARDRAEEAGRWRAAAVAFPVIAAVLLFGGTTGGEGLRAIVALVGAAVIAARAPAEARMPAVADPVERPAAA